MMPQESNWRPGKEVHTYNPTTLGSHGIQEQPGQDGETPSLLKIQKLAKRGGPCL